MPIKLTNPLHTVELDYARIAALKIDTNPCRGEQAVTIWVIVGRMEDGALVQYPDPRTGEQAAWMFKIEDGNHPLSPNMAFGKCQTCGKWHRAVGGVCDECEGSIAPYDGLSRLIGAAPQGESMYEAVQRAVYAFLLTEEVPHPETWETVKLLDGTME